MADATRTVTFGSAVGMHARPAALIAQTAADSGHTITLTATGNGKTANAASVLFLLAMGVAQGDEVLIEVEGDDADRVADELADMIARELDE